MVELSSRPLRGGPKLAYVYGDMQACLPAFHLMSAFVIPCLFPGIVVVSRALHSELVCDAIIGMSAVLSNSLDDSSSARAGTDTRGQCITLQNVCLVLRCRCSH